MKGFVKHHDLLSDEKALQTSASASDDDGIVNPVVLKYVTSHVSGVRLCLQFNDVLRKT